MDQPVTVAEGMILDEVAASARVGNPWLVLAVAFLVSVAAVMAQFAAPPLMPVLMDQFGIGIAEASSLMSIFSITGLLLALPAGLVLQRFGPLVTGAVAMLSVIAGSVLAATTTDYGVLLLSRAVQGVGIGLIGVTAPAVVAAAFPPERRGTPMGIWAMWVPVGGLLMYLVAPTLAAAYGWAAVWWLAAAVAAVGLVAYVVVLRRAGMAGAGQGSGSSAEAVAELRAGLGGRDVWLLVLSFALFATAASAPNTFTTTFLAEERGLDLTTASLLAGLVLAGAAIGSVLGGAVSDRIGSRRRVIVGGLDRCSRRCLPCRSLPTARWSRCRCCAWGSPWVPCRRRSSPRCRRWCPTRTSRVRAWPASCWARTPASSSVRLSSSCCCQLSAGRGRRRCSGWWRCSARSWGRASACADGPPTTAVSRSLAARRSGPGRIGDRGPTTRR